MLSLIRQCLAHITSFNLHRLEYRPPTARSNSALAPVQLKPVWQVQLWPKAGPKANLRQGIPSQLHSTPHLLPHGTRLRPATLPQAAHQPHEQGRHQHHALPAAPGIPPPARRAPKPLSRCRADRVCPSQHRLHFGDVLRTCCRPACRGWKQEALLPGAPSQVKAGSGQLWVLDILGIETCSILTTGQQDQLSPAAQAPLNCR